jgi:glycerophosphoryl diester phosphodiesterase
MRFVPCLLLLVAAMPTSQPIKSPYNVRDHQPLEKFIVQAHRGAGELAEENTLEAFELGWKLNCVPESDVRTTRDGVIVAFHDNTFDRVVKGVDPAMAKKGVKDVTYEELSKMDVGAWKGESFVGHHVVKMSDVFNAMKGRPQRQLYLDFKNVALPQLAEEVKKHGVEAQVILASTKYDIIRQWKKILPQSQTLLWMRGTDEELNKRFEELRNTDFADVTQLQIHVHFPPNVTTVARNSVNPFLESDKTLVDRGEEVRAHGILFQTLPYGASTPEVYWKLLDLGVMSFATDHPDVTWDAVKEYYRERQP